MDLSLKIRQRELVEMARALALEKFAVRAIELDKNATFPFEDYRDLHSSGLLALCIPERFGGLGEGFETYCLVAEQLALGNAATALTFNMHSTTMLMMGSITDDIGLEPDLAQQQEAVRSRRKK